MPRNGPKTPLAGVARPWLVLAPLLLIAACGQEPAEPAGAPVQASDAGPSFSWMNNPDNGNINIFRFEDGYAICWNDSETSLRACHSTLPLGGGTEPDCGLQGDEEPVAQQWAQTGENVRMVLQGPVWITVRDLAQAGDCFDALLIAEGPGSLYGTDNDLFGVDPDASNTNAWGWSATGALTTPGGAEVGYSGHARSMFSERGDFKSLSADVNIH
jgi:hypothetical protein